MPLVYRHKKEIDAFAPIFWGAIGISYKTGSIEKLKINMNSTWSSKKININL